MKVTRAMSVCLLFALFTLLPAGAVSAQDDAPEREPDPQAIADRCVGNLDRAGHNCVRRIDGVSGHAVEDIEMLLEEEKVREALGVGRLAIGRINELARDCVARIKEQSDKCAAVLVRLESPGLAREVKEAAHRNIRAVLGARAEGVAAVRDALPEREPVPAEVE